jgi:hypothetical protein
MKKSFIIALLLSSLLSASSDNNKTWNTKSIEPTYSINFDKNTSCLVRNLKLYKEPKWVAKIEVETVKLSISALQSRCLSFILDLQNGMMLV